MEKEEQIEKNTHINCSGCKEKIMLGESLQYEPSTLSGYCNNGECSDGLATTLTVLEPCWWE